MSAISPKSKPAKAPFVPVGLVDSNAARVYNHIYPIVVLSSYLIQFRGVVANPAGSLTALLFPLAILQVVYLVLCLPPTGSSTTSTPPKSGASKGSRKKTLTKSDVTLSQRIAPAFLSLTLALLLGTPVLTCVAILFGAPVTSHQQLTILCCAHLSLLTVPPLIYVHGLEKEKWRAIIALLLPVDEVYGAALGTLLGAWIGAVPIPLDWDRDWQKWPITIVTGAYLGWAVGKFAGGTILREKVIDLSE